MGNCPFSGRNLLFSGASDDIGPINSTNRQWADGFKEDK
jgi:hypothetical protein